MLRSAPPGMHWDDTPGLPGFGMRAGAKAKTFILVHNNGRRLKLGRWPLLSLAQAREQARIILAEKTLGIVKETSTLLFEDATTLFLAACENRTKARTVSDYRGWLTRNISNLHRRPLAAISPQEIGQTLDRLKNTPTEAVHTFTTLRTFFRFCVERGFIPRSPLEGMKRPARLHSRERVLTDQELAAVLKAAITIGYPYGHLVLMLAYTGQRRQEIGGMRAEWVDTTNRTILFPKEICKNGRAHLLPYGDAVAQLLTELPQEGYLFRSVNESMSGRFNGFAHGKDRIDRIANIAPWRIHDLRRTLASGLQHQNVRIEVTEKILHHVSGKLGGIAGVYQRADLMEPQRAAIQAWEAKILSLVG